MQFHRDEICPAARRGPAAKRKPLTAISGTDQSQLFVAWRTRLILTNRLSAVPIFLASLVSSLPRIPRAGFRDVFPRLDELKTKNRDCSQSNNKSNIELICTYVFKELKF